MDVLRSLFLSLCFIATLLPDGVAANSIKRVFEKRETVPHGWTETHRPEPNLVVPVRIGLKQANVDRLEDFLMAISHPDSKEYGQHWTPEQVAATFAPTKESIQTVQNWLLSSGVNADRIRLSKSQGWIQFDSTIQEMEDLLDSRYKVYKHNNGAKNIGGSTSYL